MARVNVDILGISELKWTGMGEFNSDNHYIYYCGQESLKRNGVTIIVNKRVWISPFFLTQGKLYVNYNHLAKQIKCSFEILVLEDG